MKFYYQDKLYSLEDGQELDQFFTIQNTNGTMTIIQIERILESLPPIVIGKPFNIPIAKLIPNP
jgi:hypothetical protein